MTRVKTLREQARVLRSLANSFDDDAIRQNLIKLAERCEELAAGIEQSIRRGSTKPAEDGR